MSGTHWPLWYSRAKARSSPGADGLLPETTERLVVEPVRRELDVAVDPHVRRKVHVRGAIELEVQARAEDDEPGVEVVDRAVGVLLRQRQVVVRDVVVQLLALPRPFAVVAAFPSDLVDRQLNLAVEVVTILRRELDDPHRAEHQRLIRRSPRHALPVRLHEA